MIPDGVQQHLQRHEAVYQNDIFQGTHRVLPMNDTIRINFCLYLSFPRLGIEWLVKAGGSGRAAYNIRS